MTEGLQSNVSGVMDDPAMKPLKDLSELATRPRQKLAEYALEAEAEERAKREAKLQAADEPVETVEPVDPPPADDTPESSTGGERRRRRRPPSPSRAGIRRSDVRGRPRRVPDSDSATASDSPDPNESRDRVAPEP